MTTCGYCQTPNSDEARFCYRCGVDLTQYSVAPTARYSPPVDVTQQAISILDRMWPQLGFQEKVTVLGLLPHSIYRTHWAEQRLKRWVDFREMYDPRMYLGH